MPTARAFAGAAEAGGKIYVIGGWDGEKALSINQVYQVILEGEDDKVWIKGVSMPNERYRMGLVTLNDTALIIGGINDLDTRIEAFQFSILELTWNEMANPFENITWSNMGIVNIGNQIYVIGGKRNNSFTNYNYAYQAFYTIVLPFIEK